MKKLLLFGLVMAFFAGTALSAPVDVNLAKNYGQSFVRNSLEKRSAEVELAYTKLCENGMPAFYIFSYDHGYVMVAADDCAYPILAYSEDCDFDATNLPDGFLYYMNHYARQIQYAVENNIGADNEIAEQWCLLGKEGVISKTRLDRGVSPILTTSWNQDYPYNYYAPAAGGAPGGHCYAGCVATAMSQEMKHWNWPETGNGEYSYSTSSYGGTLSANFGATTYNWSIMPNSAYSLNDGALAIALLMYHCGIAVDMNFSPNGSGAFTDDVPNAVISYFRYGTCTNLKYRDSYQKQEWEDMIIDNLDRGIPLIYSAQDDNGGGGHAFNCDGYDNQGRFHFNFGWSGYCTNYYYIDALNLVSGDHFNTYQKAVFNMIPDYIYDALVPAFETFEVEVPDAITKTVNVSFTAPTVSESGADLIAINQVVLKRNGVPVHVFENVQPGESLVYEDELDEYGAYVYSIYGINFDVPGRQVSKSLIVGPNCTWKVVCTTSNFQGWNQGKLQFVDAGGVIFKEVTMTTSTPISEKFQMPEGDYSLQWYAPTTAVSSLTISLKNSANQSVYSFNGNSSQLNGTLYSGNNDCPGCTPPTNLTGNYHYDDGSFGTYLTWECDYAPNKFKVYRSEDGVEYSEIAAVDNTVNEYFDPVDVGGYYYKVTAFNSACESTPALTVDNTDYVYVMVTDVTEGKINAQVYPNPVEGILYVKAEGIVEVSVYDILGQRIYRQQGGSDVVEINMAAFEPGMYLINVTTAEGVASSRVVVK